MKKKSKFKSFYAILILGVFAIAYYFINNAYSINADQGDSFYIANPLKMGDNRFAAIRPVDLSTRFIGINGSLLTIEEAKRRGIIDTIVDEKGNELNSNNLLVANSSFIIKVQDISASPALYLEGIK
jgi:hypothetical protein